MYAVEHSQEIWPSEDVQAGSLVSSASGHSRSELDTFGGEMVTGSETALRSTSTGNGPSFKTPGILRTVDKTLSRNGQPLLPHEKAFSIQIGWKLFRLSGASITSDAPSYFSNYFEEQVKLEENGGGAIKTLFIDRDPDTFADICRHLQGYWIHPRDNAHYVRLYADAQFYSLPRLISQLFEAEICVSIGGQQFQIPRDTFTGPGNSSNFFSLGFAGFLSSRDDAFPGLESRGLMRPPALPPQSVPNRSPRIFSDLIDIARGYPLDIRDSEHRDALLSDCRYYGLKGLMHKIFVHEISYNAERNVSEIVMRLEDLHKSGISFLGDASPSDASPSGGWVNYARPFVDETSYEAVVEIGSSETKIDWRSMRAVFYGVTKARISSLFQVVADKMNLPSNLPLGLMMSSGGASAAPASPANTPLSEDRVKISIGPDAAIVLDGQDYAMADDSNPGPLHHFHDEYGEDSSSPSTTTTRSSYQFQQQQQVQQQQQQQQQQFNHAPPQKKRKRDSGPHTTTTSAVNINPPSTPSMRQGSLEEFGEWIIRKGQWRMRVQTKTDPLPQQQLQPTGGGGRGGRHNSGAGLGPGGGGRPDDGGMEIMLVAVRLEAISGQRGRNAVRGFLG